MSSEASRPSCRSSVSGADRGSDRCAAGRPRPRSVQLLEDVELDDDEFDEPDPELDDEEPELLDESELFDELSDEVFDELSDELEPESEDDVESLDELAPADFDEFDLASFL